MFAAVPVSRDPRYTPELGYWNPRGVPETFVIFAAFCAISPSGESRGTFCMLFRGEDTKG
jgi:hypothetical protein